MHVPWCEKKCPYCDFNSHQHDGALPISDYLAVIKEELEQQRNQVHERKLHSIFFGGGTPSLLPGDALTEILQAAEKNVGFTNDIEITLEANPNSADQQRFVEYRQAGVNRLSIGVQSFSAEKLQSLGRIHSAQQAEQAVRAARQAGFKNINLDLMHGLPQQNLQQALDDVRKAIELAPEHISWYQLTIEKNTVFYRQPPQLPQDDDLADIEAEGLKLLAEAGYERYEVSAFAKNNRYAKHNLNYWQFGDYIGIGPGAHGKLSQHYDIERTQVTRTPNHYLDVTRGIDQKRQTKPIAAEELVGEFALNALRTTVGLQRQQFEQRTGLPYTKLEATLNALVGEGLMQATTAGHTTTELGLRFLNDVVARFMEI